MFDQYSRMARSKGFWVSPVQPFACPKMREDIPCQSKPLIWKDLNNCDFKICKTPPEFGKNLKNILEN